MMAQQPAGEFNTVEETTGGMVDKSGGAITSVNKSKNEERMRAGIGQVLEAHRGERHLVVLQDYPDPDGISSAFAHQIISAEFDISVDIIYRGRISHLQNVTLVKLLGINLIRYTPAVELAHYAGAVFLDNQGTSAETITQALEKHGIPPLIVVDHHERQERLAPEFSDIRHVGATATIYAIYLADGLLQMDKARKEHVLAATALLHGLITDTHEFIRAGDEDFQAAAFLSRFRDPDLLEQIMSQARSRQTMETIRRALTERVIAESFSIAGIGYLRSEDRDAIPQAADFLLTEENVHTAIVYGIVTRDDQQEFMVGSMRTARITVDPDAFIKEVFGQDALGKYFGGGRPMAGAFEIAIGFLSGGREDAYRDHKWQVYDEQIKRKIFDKIGVE
jgi:nanoRNase/pAp phosphatase (c-di-AMP/oligoRNAs hydrolase)